MDSSRTKSPLRSRSPQSLQGDDGPTDPNALLQQIRKDIEGVERLQLMQAQLLQDIRRQLDLAEKSLFAAD